MPPNRATLLLALFAALLVRVEDARPPTLTHGPLLGAIDDRTLKVWVRTDRAADVRVRHAPVGERDTERSSDVVTTAAHDDFTAVVTLRELSPSTRYTYRVELATPGSLDWRDAPALPRQAFRTLRTRGSSGKLRFVVGADIARHGSRGLAALRKVDPDFVLLLGDNAYVDKGKHLEAYRAAYRKAWGAPPMRELMAQVPTFMIWDDHEIFDNYWAGRTRRYTPARKAYEEYQHAHNPQAELPGALHYRVVAGDVELFVLDVRSHRSPNDAPDGPDKSMLGAAQKQALLRFVATSPARLRVLASPTTFSPHANTGNDAWNGFAHERRQILDALTAAREPTLLLSGDQHWNALLRLTHRHRGRERSFYELLASPTAAPRRPAPLYANADILARDDDHDVFGVVDVDTDSTPMRLSLTMCVTTRRCRPGRERRPRSALEREGKSETVPYTVTLPADALSSVP